MADNAIELEAVAPREPSDGLQISKSESTDSKLTKTRLSSVHTSDNDAQLPTVQQRNMARIQLISLGWTLFLIGWNDGSTGPLLPRIQEVYHVSQIYHSRLLLTLHIGRVRPRITNFRLCMRRTRPTL